MKTFVLNNIEFMKTFQNWYIHILFFLKKICIIIFLNMQVIVFHILEEIKKLIDNLIFYNFFINSFFNFL